MTYPTDTKIIYASIEKSELLIDLLYLQRIHKIKPRTERTRYWKIFLRIAQNRNPTKKKNNKAVKKLLTGLKNNIKSIHALLDQRLDDLAVLKAQQYKCLLVIQTVYHQQKGMQDNKIRQTPDLIVSIHQPHVRPIVRGKLNSKVEFGSKIQVTLMTGFAFLDEFSRDAFNEGKFLLRSVEKYKARFGYYPQSVLADKIYCNRENQRFKYKSES